MTATDKGPQHLTASLTRAKFEQMIEEFVSKTMIPVENALKDAGASTSEINEVILVGGSTRIPAVRAAVEKYFGKTANSSVNPDEVVALGAAVQGGVFTGDVTDMLLLDVTPLSLGIETLGGVMTTLIKRNTTIPCTKSETFSTAEDNQAAVDVHVLQGERQFAKDNRTLGNFRLDGLPPAMRGVPQVEVTFDIDANGIVNVSAKDKATNKEQSITITGGSSGSLSDDQINEMIDEAEKFEEEDKHRLDVVTSRNALDNLIYQSEKQLSENGEKITEDLRQELENVISNAKDAVDTDDLASIQEAQNNLASVVQKVGEELYSAVNQEQETPAEEGGDDVVDADFEDVE